MGVLYLLPLLSSLLRGWIPWKLTCMTIPAQLESQSSCAWVTVLFYCLCSTSRTLHKTHSGGGPAFSTEKRGRVAEEDGRALAAADIKAGLGCTGRAHAFPRARAGAPLPQVHQPEAGEPRDGELKAGIAVLRRSPAALFPRAPRNVGAATVADGGAALAGDVGAAAQAVLPHKGAAFFGSAPRWEECSEMRCSHKGGSTAAEAKPTVEAEVRGPAFSFAPSVTKPRTPITNASEDKARAPAMSMTEVAHAYTRPAAPAFSFASKPARRRPLRDSAASLTLARGMPHVPADVCMPAHVKKPHAPVADAASAASAQAGQRHRRVQRGTAGATVQKQKPVSQRARPRPGRRGVRDSVASHEAAWPLPVLGGSEAEADAGRARDATTPSAPRALPWRRPDHKARAPAAEHREAHPQGLPSPRHDAVLRRPAGGAFGKAARGVATPQTAPSAEPRAQAGKQRTVASKVSSATGRRQPAWSIPQSRSRPAGAAEELVVAQYPVKESTGEQKATRQLHGAVRFMPPTTLCARCCSAWLPLLPLQTLLRFPSHGR